MAMEGADKATMAQFTCTRAKWAIVESGLELTTNVKSASEAFAKYIEYFFDTRQRILCSRSIGE